MINIIFTKYRSTIASIIGLTLVFSVGRGYIGQDVAQYIAELSTLVFGAVNITNHITK